MEDYTKILEEANKKIKLADHMYNMTYPVMKDKNLLIVTMENIFIAVTKSVTSLLLYERKFKNIPPFADNFDSKFELFKDISKKHGFVGSDIELLQKVKDIMKHHNESQMEFQKKEKIVFYGEDNKMISVSINDIKDILNKAKLFIDKVNFIFLKNESGNSRNN